MAAGDTYLVGLTSVAAAASLTIQPSGTIEAVIHNLYVPIGTSWELYATDGTNPQKIDQDSGANGGRNYGAAGLHVTNAQYLTCKNTSGSTIYMRVDGIVLHA
jgi:hypothetical protein